MESELEDALRDYIKDGGEIYITKINGRETLITDFGRLMVYLNQEYEIENPKITDIMDAIRNTEDNSHL